MRHQELMIIMSCPTHPHTHVVSLRVHVGNATVRDAPFIFPSLPFPSEALTPTFKKQQQHMAHLKGNERKSSTFGNYSNYGCHVYQFKLIVAIASRRVGIRFKNCTGVYSYSATTFMFYVYFNYDILLSQPSFDPNPNLN